MLKSWSLVFGAVFAAFPVEAQSVKLQAHEIAALLRGNTAVGEWQNTPYRQYFAKDGTTIFAQEGTRSTRGEWRVDPDNDEYQSIWPKQTKWEGWFVMEFAGAFFWVSKSTPPTPFRVIEGQKLVFPAVTTVQDFCASLDRFMQPVTADTKNGEPVALPVPASPKPVCGTSMAPTGEISRHCHWSFDYRSAAAKDAFAATFDAATSCLAQKETSQSAPDVNHPDSYDLRAFEVDGGTLSVSLKDKGQLQQTLIFLRMEHLGTLD